MTLDTVIVDGTLLTMQDDRLGIINDGAVGMDNSRIAYVGPVDGCPDGRTTVDASGCAVLPGLVDAHVHSTHTLLRGGAQDVPEIEWMNRALGPLANASTDADREAGARLGVLEAVRGGATTIGEYTEHVGDLVERVHRPLGVRTVAIETINEVPEDRSDADPDEPYPFDRSKGRRALSRADELVGRFSDDPLVTPAYGPQAVDMVSLDLLEEALDRAATHDARVHVHVAQGEREQRQIAARYGEGATTVTTLDAAGLLRKSLVAVHCHGTTSQERSRLIEQGVSFVGCPSSIAAIDGRVPPIADYTDRGGVVGVGTDQAPGPGHHSMFREARTASTLAKVTETDPTALPAWRSLRMATVGGARALGIAGEVGTLAVGKQGDVVVVDLDRLSTAPSVSAPFHTAVPNLVYSTTGREVRDVFVQGDAVIRNGNFVHVDPEAVITEATGQARALYQRATDEWRAAGSTLVDRVEDGWL